MFFKKDNSKQKNITDHKDLIKRKRKLIGLDEKFLKISVYLKGKFDAKTERLVLEGDRVHSFYIEAQAREFNKKLASLYNFSYQMVEKSHMDKVALENQFVKEKLLIKMAEENKSQPQNQRGERYLGLEMAKINKGQETSVLLKEKIRQYQAFILSMDEDREYLIDQLKKTYEAKIRIYLQGGGIYSENLYKKLIEEDLLIEDCYKFHYANFLQLEEDLLNEDVKDSYKYISGRLFSSKNKQSLEKAV